MKFGEKNIGAADKALRVVVAVALIAAVAAGYIGAPWSYVAALLALIVAATAVFGTCYLYSLLGMNTLGAKGK